MIKLFSELLSVTINLQHPLSEGAAKTECSQLVVAAPPKYDIIMFSELLSVAINLQHALSQGAVKTECSHFECGCQRMIRYIFLRLLSATINLQQPLSAGAG